MREIFLNSEPLLLFCVIGLGYIIGQIKIKGFSLGIAGVLFVGLLFGGWRPDGAPPLKIAREISEVGLILFVYVVGLSSGAGFFATFRRRGLRFNLAVVTALICGAIITFIGGKLLKLPVDLVAGVYCGGLTNTPALAAVTELAKDVAGVNPSNPAVGYSITYPFGVIGGLLAFHLFFRLLRRNYAEEQTKGASGGGEATNLVVKNFVVQNPQLFERAIGELEVREKTGLIISRVRHNDKIIVPTKYTVLHKGDVVVAVGKPEDIERAVSYFGAESSERLEFLSCETIDVRRILVSRRDIVGKTIGELELDRKYNAQITRLRRADIELVPSSDTILEWGDSLMVVMPREKVSEVIKFFGDSLRGIAEINYTALTLGISCGVLLGMIPLPVPGGKTISLGFAGGPLIMGLILGRLSRTGPLLWSIPFGASQVLSHIGLLFFLAGIGVRAGGDFFTALSSTGAKLFLLGVLTTSVTTLLSLWLLRVYARATVVQALGATSGMQTQPATMACAFDLTRSNETYIAYATTYPISMISKIILAQLLFIFGQNLL